MNFNKEDLIYLSRDDLDLGLTSGDKLLEALKSRDRNLLNYIGDFVSKEENSYFLKNPYDIVAYTVGFSPFTTILSLSLLRPREGILLVHTRETIKKYGSLYDYFTREFFPGSFVESIVVEDPSDTVEGFSKIYEKLKTYGEKRIGLDITGGKKPTVAIGYLSGALLEEASIDILYLDFKKYIDTNPEYGTEFLSRLLNPIDLFSQVDKYSLEEMFRSRNYKGARILGENILEKLERNRDLLVSYNVSNQLEDVERIVYFSRLYEDRFNFNYEEVEINKTYLTEGELEALRSLKRFYSKTKDLTGPTRDKRIYRLYREEPKTVLYGVLDRYISALEASSLDLQNYIVRLISVVELAGIIPLRAKALAGYKFIDTSQKINVLGDMMAGLRDDLHRLRLERNTLGIIHGSSSVGSSNKDYERAVLKYIDFCFMADFKIDEDLIKNVAYRSYEDINGRE